uniref:Uncharacterized protein n=1 Tax=Arundo donax TaxID=35708 RepID=A0A0A8ZL81_ARUDO
MEDGRPAGERGQRQETQPSAARYRRTNQQDLLLLQWLGGQFGTAAP